MVGVGGSIPLAPTIFNTQARITRALRASPALIVPAWHLLAALLLVCAWAAGTAGKAGAQGLAALDASTPVTFFIGPIESSVGARDADLELARWAFATWQSALGSAATLVPTTDERSAVVRLYWAQPGGGQYGEMVPVQVGDRRGAAVFIRPDTTALGPEIAALAEQDPLFRDTIVYLTCVHELGHALGLEHTDEFADIMYFFGYGGDIGEYFARFRRQLASRADVPRATALSPNDRGRLLALYATQR